MRTTREVFEQLAAKFPQAVVFTDAASVNDEIQADPVMLHFIGQFLRDELGFTALRQVLGTPQAKGCSLRYQFEAPGDESEFTLRLELDGNEPAVLTLADLFPSIRWQEEEIEEDCRVQFQTHPECTRPGCSNYGRGTRCLKISGAPAPFAP